MKTGRNILFIHIIFRYMHTVFQKAKYVSSRNLVGVKVREGCSDVGFVGRNSMYELHAI